MTHSSHRASSTHARTSVPEALDFHAHPHPPTRMSRNPAACAQLVRQCWRLLVAVPCVAVCTSAACAVLSRTHHTVNMAAATEATGERTKYKALVRFYQGAIARALGKDAEATAPSTEQVAALAKILEVNSMTPTRVDRRFPNTNQASNCWYVSPVALFQACARRAQRARATRCCAARAAPLQDCVQRVPAVRGEAWPPRPPVPAAWS